MTAAPDGTYPLAIPCTKCGQLVHTYSEVDPDMTMDVRVPSTRGGWVDKKDVQIIRQLINLLVCNQCTDQRIAERGEVTATSRAHEWKSICPPEYRSIDPSRLPSPTKLERVLRWTFGPKGLVLNGASGRGKTRCAWRLLQREFFKGRNVSCIDARFSILYTKQMSISGLAAFDWLDHQMKVDLLLVDDALKIRMDSGAELALFALVEERMANQRPIILTTQDTSETLKTRMSSDRGEALIRRLKEIGETITF